MMFDCFHVCMNKGTKEEIKDKAPFKSIGKNKWLGEGFYFWTDSDHWAMMWKNTAYHGNGVIIEYHVSIEKEKLLDLVGNVKQQIEFYSAWKKISIKLGEKINNISAYIMLLRESEKHNPGSFSYWGVRAKDANPSVKHIDFIERDNEKDKKTIPYSSFYERHQLCVYEEFKEYCVTFSRFTYPKIFCYN